MCLVLAAVILVSARRRNYAAHDATARPGPIPAETLEHDDDYSLFLISYET